MGKTKKVKEKKGKIMIDDHVLLSDISDYEYDTLVEKPQSIGTCNNFEKISSLSVSVFIFCCSFTWQKGP